MPGPGCHLQASHTAAAYTQHCHHMSVASVAVAAAAAAAVAADHTPDKPLKSKVTHHYISKPSPSNSPSLLGSTTPAMRSWHPCQHRTSYLLHACVHVEGYRLGSSMKMNNVMPGSVHACMNVQS
mmetsp:Transcript_29025/g.64060  ORF Transcript_29025/g.64060 Transcript_29025/m.64060 type:complete len:125 (+) Transcript_29025:1993-2367(+)